VKDVVRTTEANIARSGVRTVHDVRRLARPLVRYNPERRRLNLHLRRYLYANLYYNPVVQTPNRRAVAMLKDLFRHYLERPEDMGAGARERFQREDPHRTVCDYLAGMTDRYAIQEYQRLLKGGDSSSATRSHLL